MNDRQEKALKTAIQNAEESLDYKMASLRGRCEALVSSLNSTISNIDRRGNKAVINSCGEIQARGPSIDRLCAEIGIAKEALGHLNALSEALKEAKK